MVCGKPKAGVTACIVITTLKGVEMNPLNPVNPGRAFNPRIKILKAMQKVENKYEKTPEECKVRRARLLKKFVSLNKKL